MGVYYTGYIVEQYSTVQYSTVQVSAVQYRDYKKDGQWTRRNEDINPGTRPNEDINPGTQIRMKNMKLWESLKVKKVRELLKSVELRHIIPEERMDSSDKDRKDDNRVRKDETAEVWYISQKQRNKKKKAENGNGVLKQSLLIAQWNMGSKRWHRKKLEIETVILQHNPDILVISEANMEMDKSEEENDVQGYEALVPLGAEEQGLARLVVLVREGITVKVQEQYMDKIVAAVWMRIGCRGRKPITLGAVYRQHKYIYEGAPETSGTDEQQLVRFKKLVEKWVSAADSGDVMLVGDVNVDYKKWDQTEYRLKDMVELLKDEVETLGFFQMVKEVTRSWNNQTDSILDHCWLNAPERLVYVKNIPRTYSDHNLVLMSIRTKNRSENRQNVVKRERKNMDVKKYTEDIGNIDWGDFYQSEDIDYLNNYFEEKVLKILDEAAPIKTIQSRRKFRNWISEDLKDKMKERDDLRELARNSRRQEDWESYKVARNRCVKEVEKCKNEHHQKLFTDIEKEKSTKNLYRMAGELLDRKDGTTPQEFLQGGNIIRKTEQMAEMQMKFYEQKVEGLLDKIPISGRNPYETLEKSLDRWEKKDSFEKFKFRSITIVETAKLISSLSDSNALGHDGMDSIAIKTAASRLLKPVQHLVNTSLKKGKFAQKWKISRITPRLKNKGLDRLECSSYRPVAVLSTISKLVERTAQQQLLKYLEDTGQLNSSNHAYRKNMSTTTTLMEILDELYQGAEDKEISSMMTVDQSSAFDCVSHEQLIQKLRLYRVGDEAIDWLKDYLSYRTQYVIIGSGKSTMKAVSRGVPQGSVIGPLLYAVFTNELTETIKKPECQNIAHQHRDKLFGRQCKDCGKMFIYADDSTYVVSSKKRETNQLHLRRSLDEIKMFLGDNQLVINQPKTSLTETMVSQKKTKTKGEPPWLTVEKEPGIYRTVKDSGVTRILGANIQANMLWTQHLETGEKALFPQVRKLLGQLRHIGKMIPRRSRLTLARGLVLSRLCYLMPLWGGAAKTHIGKAQIIMNAAARWATGLGKRTRVRKLMEETGWLTIEEQIRMSTAVLSWKLVHLKKPERMRERMLVTEDYKLMVEDPRLQFVEDCFRWRASRQWNQLSDEMRQLNSVSAFKRRLRQLILTERARLPDEE